MEWGTMDNFRVIHRILSYLEEAMDYDKLNMERISAKRLGVSEPRWNALMRLLTQEGYIEWKDVMQRVVITLKGLEYLQENPIMAAITKEIAERSVHAYRKDLDSLIIGAQVRRICRDGKRNEA